MGGTADRLRQRLRRREEWIASAAARFEADADVAAAWLFGSEGRGGADELSDLDVFVAIDDRAADRLLPELGVDTFDAFGDVMTWEEITDGAPEGGRAFVVAYQAPVERLSVHWRYQRAGTLQLGSDARVLVDKVGIPVAYPPLATTSMLPEREAPRRSSRRADRLQERVMWFWTIAPVVAKWLARGWLDRAEPELERMAGVVEEALAFLNRQPPERHADAAQVRPLSRLRSLMVELVVVGDGLAEAGVTLPSTDRAYGWLELAEDLEAERWVPNSAS